MKEDRRKLDFGSGRPLVEAGEIFSDLGYTKGSSLFLGRYTLNEVIAVLGKRGFLREAEKRGFGPLVFDLDSTDPPLQRLRIFHREKTPERVIVDLKIKEMDYVPRAALEAVPRFRCLAFEWLTLQNPLLDFDEDRTPLPGQARPGLNLGHKVLDVFIYLARLIRQDALLAFPAYFHNALLFSRQFRFLNPRKEGEVYRHPPRLPARPLQAARLGGAPRLRPGARRAALRMDGRGAGPSPGPAPPGVFRVARLPGGLPGGRPGGVLDARRSLLRAQKKGLAGALRSRPGFGIIPLP